MKRNKQRFLIQDKCAQKIRHLEHLHLHYAFSRRFFIQSDLHCIPVTVSYILSALAFPGNRTHDLWVRNKSQSPCRFRPQNLLQPGHVPNGFKPTICNVQAQRLNWVSHSDACLAGYRGEGKGVRMNNLQCKCWSCIIKLIKTQSKRINRVCHLVNTIFTGWLRRGLRCENEMTKKLFLAF